MEKYAIKEVQHLIINQIQTYLQLQNRNDPETTTPIQTVVISPTKTANLTFAEIGDNVTYTVTFTNQGTIPATGVTITDSLPPSTTFVTNSVTVNTIPQPGVSPISGISVGTVNHAKSSLLRSKYK